MRRGSIVIFVFLFWLLLTMVVFGEEIISSNETVIVNGKISDNRENWEGQDIKVITPISDGYNKLTDYPKGYSLKYPNHMSIDVYLSFVKTVIFDETTQMEIYYDDLNGTLANAWNYIYYSNGFIINTIDHVKEDEKTFKYNGYTFHMLKWHRNKLARIDNDKNYYLSVEIIKNGKEIYTLFIKSSDPINQQKYMEIIKSFQTIEKKGKPYIQKLDFENNIRNWNKETRNFYEDYFINNEKLTWGIFDNYMPKYLDLFKDTEEMLDFKFKFIIQYQNFPLEENIDDIKNALNTAYDDDRYVELTFQTTKEDEEGNIVYDILNGEYDSYFRDYAEMLREFGHPVMFRLNNEMNGDWCLYSSYYTSKDTMIYKELYKYLYSIFEENKVDNIIWIWNPHDRSFPNFKWNHALAYYPGNAFVDVIGLTGYNTGTYYSGEEWRGFKEIYDSMYFEYDQFFNKPFMITEFASSSVGGDKEEWIKEMFENISKYKKIKAAVWWNGCDYDTEGKASRIYRLDQSPSMLHLFRRGLQKFK